MRILASIVLALLFLWVYPAVVFWIDEQAPYTHFVLTPWSTPYPSGLAILLGIATYIELRRGGARSADMWLFKLAAVLLSTVWASYFAFLIWLYLRGGL